MAAITDNTSYIKKMDESLSAAIKEWWQGLSKEEILQYMQDQPAITADVLRDLLGSENCTMAIGLNFDMNSHRAVADFNIDAK